MANCFYFSRKFGLFGVGFVAISSALWVLRFPVMVWNRIQDAVLLVPHDELIKFGN